MRSTTDGVEDKSTTGSIEEGRTVSTSWTEGHIVIRYTPRPLGRQ